MNETDSIQPIQAPDDVLAFRVVYYMGDFGHRAFFCWGLPTFDHRILPGRKLGTDDAIALYGHWLLDCNRASLWVANVYSDQ